VNTGRALASRTLRILAGLLIVPVSIGWWSTRVLLDPEPFADAITSALDPQVLIIPVTTFVTAEVAEATGLPKESLHAAVAQVVTPGFVTAQLNSFLVGLHGVLVAGADPQTAGLDLASVKPQITSSVAAAFGGTVPAEVQAALDSLPDRVTLADAGIPQGTIPDLSAAAGVSRGAIAGLAVLLLGLLVLSVLLAPRRLRAIRAAAFTVAIPSAILLAIAWFIQAIATDYVDRALENVLSGSVRNLLIGLLGGLAGSFVAQEVVITLAATILGLAAWIGVVAANRDRAYQPGAAAYTPVEAQWRPPYQPGQPGPTTYPSQYEGTAEDRAWP